VASQIGAEVIRLWVASVDYREDVVASIPLLERLAKEIYFKLRNTFKFLLGNLHGFDPVRDSLAFEDLQPLDQYMLAKTRELTEKVLKWYEEFEFNRIFHAINEFCNADLSALYLDVLKDRMYTFAPTSRERLSAQTALYKITDALVRLVAPILSYTADEVWGYMPEVEGRVGSVHLAEFPVLDDLAPAETSGLKQDWFRLLDFRSTVMVPLESLRQSKHIGKASEAKVVVAGSPEELKLLARYASSFRELLNVSQVEFVPESPAIQAVKVLLADGVKCERCWNYRTDTDSYGPWPVVCGRCRKALDEMGYSELNASVAR